MGLHHLMTAKKIILGGINQLYDFENHIFDPQGILSKNVKYVLFADFTTYLACTKFTTGELGFKNNLFLTFSSYFSYVLRDIYRDSYGKHQCLEKAYFPLSCTNDNEFLNYLSNHGIGQSSNQDFQHTYELHKLNYINCIDRLDSTIYRGTIGFLGGSIKDILSQGKLALSPINHTLYELALNYMNSFYSALFFTLQIEYITNILQQEQNQISAIELISGTILYTSLATAYPYLFETKELNCPFFNSLFE